MAATYDRRINIYINGQQVKNDVKSIKAEMSKLINEQARMTIGSEEYNRSASKIRNLKKMIAEHNVQIGNTQSAWQKSIGIVKGLLPAFSFAAILTGAKQLLLNFAKFDDKLADVMKTTGLTKKEVVELNRSLQNIDTRTSQEELLELVRIGGKLGISGKKDLLGFAAAADKIKVALSEDLGGNVEESVNQIGKLTDIFGLKEDFGIEQAMLKVGSAINSLGAASTANEGYLVEFTKRVAGIAPSAGISIDKILGLAATLDQFGQSSEVSSTVFAQVVPDMFKDTATYAGIAKMSVSDFTELLKKDANEAFIQFLEGLNGNNGGLAEMVGKLDGLGLEGKRSISVLGVLANNTETLRNQQKFANEEFEKGTSLLTEFNTKNNTLQGGLEKLGKWFSNSYKNVLNDINESLKSSSNKFGEQLKEVQNLQTGLTPLIEEYENLQGKTELSADEQARMKVLISDIAAIAPSAITQFDEYGMVIGISADKAKEFIQAQKDILQIRNAEDIKDTEKDLERVKKKMEETQGTIKRMNDATNGGTEILGNEADWKRRFNGFIADLKTLGDERRQLENYLKSIKGEPLIDIKSQAPITGAKKTVGDQVYEWDGKEWKLVQDLGEASDDLIKAKQKELETARKMPATTEAEIAARNRKIESIQKEINRLNELGVAKENQSKLDEFLEKNAQEQQAAFYKYFSDLGEQSFEAFMAAFETEAEKWKNLGSLLEMPEEQTESDPSLDYAVRRYQETLDYKQQLLEAQWQKGLIGEQEYQDGINEIESQKSEEKYRKKEEFSQKTIDLANMAANLVFSLMDMELEQAGENEEKKKEIRKKYADIQFAVTAAQIIADTAAGIMKATAQTGIFAVIAATLIGAAGVAQLGIANAQREKVKGLKTGGFTGDGNADEPAGIVHKGEYVVPKDMVDNPNIAPIIHGLENMRRNRVFVNYGMIEATASPSGYKSGGFTGNGSASPSPSALQSFSPSSDPELKALIAENMRINQELNRQLKNGIRAHFKKYGSGDPDTLQGSLEDIDRFKSNINA